MIKLKKGDRVWLSGVVRRAVTAEQAVVVSSGDATVVVDRPSSCVQNKIRLPRDQVFLTSEEAVLAARGSLRVMAAGLEEEARALRSVADADPEIVPIEW